MRNHYQQIPAEECAIIMSMQKQNRCVREIGGFLSSAPSSISCKANHNLFANRAGYDSVRAGARARCMKMVVRQRSKLDPDTALFGVVEYVLRQKWLRDQIGGTLRRLIPDDPSQSASRETIYTALYAMPHGELRRVLFSCLHQNKEPRRPFSRGDDRRSQLPARQRIHLGPPEATAGLVRGYSGADRVKGAFNHSAVGSLIEPTPPVVDSCAPAGR